MEQLKLTGELAALNPYLPDILMMTADEFEVLEDKGLSLPSIITQEGVDHNLFFLHALGGWMVKHISPAVNWSKQFKQKYNVVEGFTGIWYSKGFNRYGSGKSQKPGKKPIEKYDIAKLLDMDSYVNMDVLMRLELLPILASEIVANIGTDFSNVSYVEGYNKKFGSFLGNWMPMEQARNLLIIDISSSIPVGISDMMLHLAPSMVLRLNADLIVTGSESYFYTHDQARVLDPIKTRNSIGRLNEGDMFKGILESFTNRSYANVVSFGDQDSPRLENSSTLKSIGLKVGKVYHYHTQLSNTPTGYGAWANDLAEQVEYMDRSWCTMFKDDDGYFMR